MLKGSHQIAKAHDIGKRQRRKRLEVHICMYLLSRPTVPSINTLSPAGAPKLFSFNDKERKKKKFGSQVVLLDVISHAWRREEGREGFLTIYYDST